MVTATAATARFASASRKVLAAGFVGSLLSVGLTIYLFGVFQDELIADFGIDVARYSWAPPIFMIVSGILSPLLGRSLATQGRAGFSIRRVMMGGACLLGVGLIALSRLDTAFEAALVFGLLVAPGAILFGPLLAQSMITNWFELRRGWALGIVSAGTTVGGMLTPPLAAVLIESVGWRDAMAALGLLSLAAGIPTALWLAKDRPEEIGEAVDGGTAEGGASPAALAQASDTRVLLRSPSLWLLGATFGLIFSAGTLSTVFTVPYASELGVPLLGGAAIASMRAGSAAAGKILLGTLSDRVGIRRVLYGVIVTEVLLTGLLVQTRDPLVFTILGVAIGFVGGAPLPLKAAMVGALFGRADFAGAMGLVQSLGVPFQLFMVPIGGLIYQATGTYAAVFGLTIPLFGLAAIGLGCLRPAGPPRI